MSASRGLPPTSPFARDDGSADPVLAGVLAAHTAGRASVGDVVAALAGARVLVAILPHGRDAVPADVAARAAYEPAASRAAVIGMAAGDGRAAMPVFTSVAALAAWRADARPVPTAAAQAARGALAEGWQVVVLDPAGPAPVRLPRPAVVALAQGTAWRPAVRDGTVDDEVAAAIVSALTGIEALGACGIVPGARGEVAVELAVRPGLDRAGLEAVVARVNQALAGDEIVATRVDSLELRLRPAG